jgi:hypothetical protein
MMSLPLWKNIRTGRKSAAVAVQKYSFNSVAPMAGKVTRDLPGSTATKTRKGRLLLNPDGFPIRKLQHMPQAVSSMIPGWEVEAICRLNPEIGDLDFRDRMAPVIQRRWKKEAMQMEDGTTRNVNVLKQKDGRPTRQNLNMRRVRDRQVMRIPTWPEPKKKTAYDQKIEEELDQWGNHQ